MVHEVDDSTLTPGLPRSPIDRLVEPLTRFLHVEAASGIALVVCAVVALVLANSPLAEGYLGFWKTKMGFRLGSFEIFHSLQHWINDGLMVIFFFVIGLEVKRELVLGELRDVRRATLPCAAALGGMLVPAGIYLALQSGETAARGWGIPMATDIAFVVGCMAVLGPRIPGILRVMLLSLAIVDDIGAILVIAVGYTDEIHLVALFLGIAGLFAILGMARLGVRSFAVYTIGGVLVWLAFHESGVHATIAGVLLGLMTPARSQISTGTFGQFLERVTEVIRGGKWDSAHRAGRVRDFQRATRETVSPLEYLEKTLHPWVGFVIMPVFALANAGVPFKLGDFTEPVALAVMAGLVIGKPVGILLSSWLAVRVVLKRLPEGLTWGVVAGAGCLAGIGFTMALFIAGLALTDKLLDAAKVGIIGGSLIAAVAGMTLLVVLLPKPSAVPRAEGVE